MGRFLKFLLGTRIEEESAHEILGHAVIGSLVTASLVLFDLVSRYWDKLPPGVLKISLAIAGVLVSFSLVFVCIYRFERWLMRRIAEQPIELTRAGDVRGTWVDVVIKSGQVWRCSEMSIDSSVGAGFRVEGSSYALDQNHNVIPDVKGRFKSMTSSFDEESIAYAYKGEDEEGPGEQRGVVFYQFSSRRYQGVPTKFFTGSFSSHGVDNAFHLIGLRIPAGSSAFEVLKYFVQSADVNNFITSLRPIGTP